MQTQSQIESRKFTINVARLGIESDLSYREMSRIIGCSDSTIRRIDKARRTRKEYTPRFRTVSKVAAAIGCPAAELLQ